MSQKIKLYKPIATLHITFREHRHTNMIIRTTAESPYILTDVMQLCRCVNARYIFTVFYHKFDHNLDNLGVLMFRDIVF
jgi:hypothetical protein